MRGCDMRPLPVIIAGVDTRGDGGGGPPGVLDADSTLSARPTMTAKQKVSTEQSSKMACKSARTVERRAELVAGRSAQPVSQRERRPQARHQLCRCHVSQVLPAAPPLRLRHQRVALHQQRRPHRLCAQVGTSIHRLRGQQPLRAGHLEEDDEGERAPERNGVRANVQKCLALRTARGRLRRQNGYRACVSTRRRAAIPIWGARTAAAATANQPHTMSSSAAMKSVLCSSSTKDVRRDLTSAPASPVASMATSRPMASCSCAGRCTDVREAISASRQGVECAHAT